MKTILLLISILISTTLFAQKSKITEMIIDFKTIERNKKNVVFSEISYELNSGFIITANNGNSKEYSRCEWKSYLSYNEMTLFIEQLSVIDIKNEKIIQNHKFDLSQNQKLPQQSYQFLIF